MPTYIYSKKDFINFIQEQVKDEEVIIFSNEVPNATASKKGGLKVTSQFYEKAFTDEGCGHVYHKDSLNLGVLVRPKSYLSEEGLKAMDNIKKS